MKSIIQVIESGCRLWLQAQAPGPGCKARLQAQTLPDATPPIGKINTFSKIAVTFEGDLLTSNGIHDVKY